MKKKRKLGRKLLSFLLTLAMVVGLLPGMGMTAYAADEVSENISLVAINSANLKTISGTHYSVSCGYMVADDKGMTVNSFGALTINARKGETITKVILSYSEGGNRNTLSSSIGTFDGNSTITGINAQQVTISSSSTSGVKISAVTVYFEGDLNNPTVTLTGGANAKSSGGLLTQSYLPGAMDTVTYTALTGAAFPAFENFTQNGVTVERTSDTVVTVSGTPTVNTAIIVPDAVSSSKIVTWNSATISSISSTIARDYTYTANGITLNKTGKGKFANNSISGYDSTASFEFTTATGKFTNIEINANNIYSGGNWTTDGNILKWNSTPSDSVSLSGTINVEGVSSINFVIEMPTVSVTVTAGNNMTKTTDSGAESQSGLSSAMTDVVYTADDGYYFPTDYSVAEVSGIKVTRDSYTQITVSGTPTADATITLTSPTAKTTPDAPTTAAAVDCTTASNNDGKLTGVTTAMEYKKSDAADWTAGTGSDITGLVPGTYYVRVKATETTNASTNQELTIKGFISYTVTFKVVNGKWNEGEGDAATADKTVTLTGHDGDTLKLTADQIPTVGTKPNDTYKAGSWDTTPSTDTEITADTTYTYTYAQKDAAVVTKAPTAKTLTYTGSAQELVTAGEATGGTMYYAATTENTAPADNLYTTSIPTGTNAGIYYVWYKVIGDANHMDSKPASVTITVEEKKEEVEEIDHYDEVPLTTGEVKDITGTEEAPAETNPYGTKIVNSESLETLLEVTDTEKADGVNVWLDVKDGTATVPETDKAKILSTAGDYAVGQYLDVNLFKKVGNNDPVKVSEPNGKVKVSIVIPASLRKDGRTFRILKVHNGEPSVIDGTYDASTGIFTFETDSFSSYAIAYKDGEEEDDDDDDDDEPAQVTPVVTTTEPRSPKTGDDMMGYSFWLMLAAAGLAVSGMAAKGRKEQE